jgi:hypothetical protein
MALEYKVAKDKDTKTGIRVNDGKGHNLYIDTPEVEAGFPTGLPKTMKLILVDAEAKVTIEAPQPPAAV